MSSYVKAHTYGCGIWTRALVFYASAESRYFVRTLSPVAAKVLPMGKRAMNYGSCIVKFAMTRC